MVSWLKSALDTRSRNPRVRGKAFFLVGLLLLFEASGLVACTDLASSSPSLRVLGAASLRDVLEDYGQAFQAETGIRIEIVTGGSTLIANQLLAGAKADLFLSAGVQEADRLEEAGLLQAGTRCVVLRNGLVVIASGEGHRQQSPGELFSGDERISLAHTGAVPAGRYAKAWLQREDLWAQVEPRCVYALDVRAALAAVESGGLGLGIVYRTDAASSDSVTVVHEIDLPDGEGVVYLGAVLQDSKTPELARSFLEFLVESNPGLAKSHGFKSAKGEA